MENYISATFWRIVHFFYPRRPFIYFFPSGRLFFSFPKWQTSPHTQSIPGELFLPGMYTITRGPSKLVTQRRTGPTQQLENKVNEFKHKQTSWNMPDLPAPKIVFNRPNGKKYHHPAPPLPPDTQHEENFTAAHEENVKFVHEAWQEVVQQSSGVTQRAVHYTETPLPSPHMDNFVPIDLDEWWAQRFLANIDKLS